MNTDPFFASFRQMKKQLGQLDTWLEAAAAHAATKRCDPKNFLGLRLVVDQFAFARQVQVVCDTAKAGAAKLTGKTAPVHPDTEETLEQLRERVQATVAFLDTLTEQDFAGAATVSITQPRWEGKTMTGADYFLEHLQPNFFFHLTTAYSLLRQNGVAIGKRDYLGALTQKAAPVG